MIRSHETSAAAFEFETRRCNVINIKQRIVYDTITGDSSLLLPAWFFTAIRSESIVRNRNNQHTNDNL